MTPDSITVSLEMAKRLKDCGWPQELDHGQYFYCLCGCEELHLCVMDNDEDRLCGQDYGHHVPEDIEEKGWYVAPHAEEILSRLPSTIEQTHRKMKSLYTREILTDGKNYLIGYKTYGGLEEETFYMFQAELYPYIPDPSLANAAAQMFVYLSEHKLLPVHS